MTGEVIEIVDERTGRISPYPAHSMEARSMVHQVERMRKLHWDHPFSVRTRYYVDACNSNSDCTPLDTVLVDIRSATMTGGF